MIQQIFPWQKEIKKNLGHHLHVVSGPSQDIGEIEHKLSQLIRAYEKDINPLLSCRIIEDEKFYYLQMQLNQDHPVINNALDAFYRVEECRTRIDFESEIDIKLIGGVFTLKIPKLFREKQERKIS